MLYFIGTDIVFCDERLGLNFFVVHMFYMFVLFLVKPVIKQLNSTMRVDE